MRFNSRQLEQVTRARSTFYRDLVRAGRALDTIIGTSRDRLTNRQIEVLREAFTILEDEEKTINADNIDVEALHRRYGKD